MASGVAKRYADAVFSLGKENGTLDKWSADLTVMGEIMSEPSVAAYLNSPSVSRQKKTALIDKALENAQPEARNLMRMLAERQRLDIVPELIDQFQQSMLAERGIAVANVTTAVELPEAELERIREQLGKVVNKQIEMRVTVDPAIIGGMVAQVGDTLIDSSVSNQLRRLRERLTATA